MQNATHVYALVLGVDSKLIVRGVHLKGSGSPEEGTMRFPILLFVIR